MAGDIVVLTQNIFGGGPGWRARRRLLARRIGLLRPDIIGLQEVHAPDTSGIGSQAHQIADMIGGYHVEFAPGRITAEGHCEGVALLCRHGIRERAVEALTLDPRDRLDRSSPRVVLCGMLEVDGHKIDVLVTHLSLSWRARARTIKELLEFARRQRARSQSRAAVLIGDLNALPGEEAMRLLESDWTDAWVLAHGSPEGGGTWPWFMPFRRIDYVFLQPASAWHLRACEREPASGSDHLGVVARLRTASVARTAEVRGGETP